MGGGEASIRPGQATPTPECITHAHPHTRMHHPRTPHAQVYGRTNWARAWGRGGRGGGAQGREEDSFIRCAHALGLPRSTSSASKPRGSCTTSHRTVTGASPAAGKRWPSTTTNGAWWGPAMRTRPMAARVFRVQDGTATLHVLSKANCGGGRAAHTCPHTYVSETSKDRGCGRKHSAWAAHAYTKVLGNRQDCVCTQCASTCRACPHTVGLRRAGDRGWPHSAYTARVRTQQVWAGQCMGYRRDSQHKLTDVRVVFTARQQVAVVARKRASLMP